MSALRKPMAPRRVETNPLRLVVGKQLLGKEEGDAVALIVLLALDSAKRGKANNAVANTLTQALTTAVYLWASLGNQVEHARASLAWQANAKASKRDPDKPLALTTTEYQAIRPAIAHYVLALPRVELARFVQATTDAVRMLES